MRADGGGCRAAAPGCRGHRAALQSLSMLERSGHGTAAACGRGLWCSAAPPWQCELLGSALPALEAPQDVAQHSKTGASLQGRSRRPVLHMPDSRRRHCHGRRARQRPRVLHGRCEPGRIIYCHYSNVMLMPSQRYISAIMREAVHQLSAVSIHVHGRMHRTQASIPRTNTVCLMHTHLYTAHGHGREQFSGLGAGAPHRAWVPTSASSSCAFAGTSADSTSGTLSQTTTSSSTLTPIPANLPKRTVSGGRYRPGSTVSATPARSGRS